MKTWTVSFAILHYDRDTVQAETAEEAERLMRRRLRTQYENTEYGYEVHDAAEVRPEEDTP